MVDIVRQSDISAERDFIGRDKVDNRRYVANVVVGDERLTTMRALIAMYREERESNAEFRETIDDLQHFLFDPEGGAPIGLEQKFELAGRQSAYLEAARRKERFAKKLHKHSLSQAAQEIFALILGRAVLLFRTYVKPLIDAGFGAAEVNVALLERVIDPIMEELEENILRLKYDDLEGMVYFLTGNCHISWHQN